VRARVLAIALSGIAACNNPPLSVGFRLTRGEAQQCTADTGGVATSCQDVTVECPQYVSVRVLDPDDPDAPYVSVCQPLTDRVRGDLCEIAGIPLPQPAMPIVEQTLEVQIAIFPTSMIVRDAITDEPVCPRVEFSADGLPMAALPSCEDDTVSCPKVPAVGGRAFYHPGDEQTVVDLGCTDFDKLKICEGRTVITVTATVADFDNLVASVDKQVADRLSVGVGQPEPFGDTHELFGTKVKSLTPVVMSSTPSWSVMLDDPMFSSACITIREDDADAVTSLTCRRLPQPNTSFNMEGVLLTTEALSTILGALGLSNFPVKGGLVVGIVLDENYNPLPGKQVSCVQGGCTIQYLSDDRTTVVTGGTSTSGVFVSRDAAFGTDFTLEATTGAEPVLGGVVEDRVTIVVLQDRGSVVGED
jgi:hypothetical protein